MAIDKYIWNYYNEIKQKGEQDGKRQEAGKYTTEK